MARDRTRTSGSLSACRTAATSLCGWIRPSRLKVRFSARACFSVSARASRLLLSRPPATNRL